MNILRGRSRAHSGQAIAEIALAVPVLFLLMAGAIDVGRYAQFQIKVANSARAAVQYGSLNLATAADTTGMKNAAVNDAPSTISASMVTPSNYCACSNAVGTAVQCTPTACSSTHRLLFVTATVSATFKPLFNYPLVSSTTVSRTAISQVSQ
jgi:Flp pilus assembly protein TadG